MDHGRPQGPYENPKPRGEYRGTSLIRNFNPFRTTIGP